ncbi:TonB-dependent receptor plug [Arcobacter nitrofigilis DSM 7299]|uniref:TonB-dependent receptor plug n=1 Tax=Arcobacter nitrofigilis (strain ATCC 33309 / DSM 7299 / CCUG 15893 / LMG 7604 / NCTC 12251 / CI) TaxID=572480 RepID=D5V1R9_ARCNC|nr:TonB-dependent receptor [Arcobacter nitrofigilis]ADG93503.1 TonB-dependent receptor plug [Arcobacter nitrofigilis DSM 7299]
MNKKLTTSLVASLLIATSNLHAEELSSLIITSPLIKTNEKDATYSTEIYTKKEIEKSNSKDVYDFLNAQTSVTVSPSFGNTFAQKIDLRGYGIGNGYQNLVISVNGRRLNNIDMQTQLLSSIPIESIEKIEIIKGSGSVEYGDGANSGVINIITNGKNDNYIKTSIGNNGVKNGTVSLGYSNDKIILNGVVDYSSTNGTRSDTNGDKDKNYKRNKNINLIYFPVDNLELRLGRTYSNMNIKYGGSLTLEQYKNNPNQVSSFTEQYFRSYVTDYGITYDISRDYSLDINYSDEDKLSKFSSGFKSNYDYKSFNTKLNIKKENYNLSLGIDGFYGDRIGSTNTTSKDNKAIFISGKYNLNKDLILSTGIRKEKVEYSYSPNTGNELNANETLSAYDLGLNYSINDTSSFFTNINKSYQAPDIDRFFNFGGTFNGFIKPAKVITYNIGYSNIQKNNKFKTTVFRSNLKNEIYYYNIGGANRNTNIDKSHKYGIEIFDKYLINKNFYTSINYSYIIAKIDNEDEGNGEFNGKDLPGVSTHSGTLNFGYNYNKFNAILSHTYRSKAYAANDFGNNFSQKQEAYNSTDLSLSYTYKNIEFFAKIENLLDEDNGLWIRDNAIYPVNFERTYYAGVKVKF